MEVKELIKAVLSRKFAIAMVGIIALCWIATTVPGQDALDEKAIVSVVPMPKVPTAGKIDVLKLAAMIGVTLITCLTVTVQWRLDNRKIMNGEATDPAMFESVGPEIEGEKWKKEQNS